MQYHTLANPIIVGIVVDKFPLTEIRDWDQYREGEGANFPNEFRALEEFCSTRISGVRRLADRQKLRNEGQGTNILSGNIKRGIMGTGKKISAKIRTVTTKRGKNCTGLLPPQPMSRS